MSERDSDRTVDVEDLQATGVKVQGFKQGKIVVEFDTELVPEFIDWVKEVTDDALED